MKQSVRKFFEETAQHKEGVYNPSTGRLTSLAGETQGQVLKALGSITQRLKFSLVLDVGSGPGRYAEMYGQKKAFHIMVDAILPMLRLARKNTRALGLSESTDFVVADMEKLPIRTGSCEFVSCIDTLHHLEQPDKDFALRELARVSSENGYVFVEIKNGFFPHYLLGLSRRNPSGISVASSYLAIRSLFKTQGLTDFYSTGALPWGLTAKLLSPSILMGFRKDTIKMAYTRNTFQPKRDL